jgi:outer membrane protein assembly factor BamC
MRIVAATCGALMLSACSSINMDEYLPDKSVEYKREKEAERNLEVPPDLTSSRINDRMSVPDNYVGVATNYSEYMTDRRLRGADGEGRYTNAVLPKNPRMRIERDRDQRWLVIDASADAVWDRVLDFWQDQGILLEEQDPELGIMRTSWLENRANIKRDVITDTIRSVFEGLYETSLRDQYRVRFERVGSQSTEIFLTHYGMEEVAQANSQGQTETTVWTPRDRDPELEVVMMRRLMVFLGAADERARAQLAAAGRSTARSQLVQGRDGVKLVVGEDFARSWRLVGLSLDRVGFAVEDRDRSNGLYYVRYNDPAAEVEEGLLSSLKFWGDDKDPSKQYQIRLAQEGRNTVVTVLDENGQRDQSNTGRRILNLLREQIR